MRSYLAARHHESLPGLRFPHFPAILTRYITVTAASA
jgi:hypothetical protein